MNCRFFSRMKLILLVFALSIGTIGCSGSQSEKTASNNKVSSGSAASGQPEKPAAVNFDKTNKDPIKVTLAGGSVGGFWSGLGQVISKSFATEYPGSAATYEPGSGAGNIKLIDEGQVEIALVQSVEPIAAKLGMPPFTKKYDNLKALSTIYDNAVGHITVRKEFAEKYGTNSLADIVTKKIPARISINQRGNLNSMLSETLLEVNGITEKTLKDIGGSLLWAGSKQRYEAFQNNRLDISIDWVFAPDHNMEETSVNTPLILWNPDQKSIAEMKKKWELNDFVVPKGTYKWQKEDYKTLALPALILVSDKVSVQDQYKMAKALVDNLDILRALHPAMKNLTPQKMANTGSIPLVPGAKALFEEVGAIKK